MGAVALAVTLAPGAASADRPRGGVMLGTPHDDRMAGSMGADRILLGRGDDRVRAYGRADQVFGGRGADPWLAGGRGDDLVLGGRGADRISGGAGGDLIVLGVVHGRRLAPDASGEAVTCGAGRDRVLMASRFDIVTRGCEVVRYGGGQRVPADFGRLGRRAVERVLHPGPYSTPAPKLP